MSQDWMLEPRHFIDTKTQLICGYSLLGTPPSHSGVSHTDYRRQVGADPADTFL